MVFSFVFVCLFIAILVITQIFDSKPFTSRNRWRNRLMLSASCSLLFSSVITWFVIH
ncbi:hypothetical protein PAESOLCIP111_04164 [Paenibacillus solanacearum]|uniref:Uncharacterized protein n=1 Tax=Paenibacillus solanacearum TaxID=2048548 RepID=A0A916NRD5_9BACL|nr:hypothetical protein [Paenibacillus solanacearum]CAG7640710.1 hypothetical protein PAESOLCIP111_04164 [Paenibacillus solanacearum]